MELHNNLHKDALKELLYKMADDQLIIGHRNSEWTGLAPMLEEDIAFSSIAQDKLGQALALYTILHEQLGERDPDTIAFLRSEKEMLCCHLVEYPVGDYDFSLVRHFLFDTAEHLRFEMLSSSAFEPLAHVARKIKGEIKYHVLHAQTWMKQLGKGTEESRARMQTALNNTMPLALGIFEPSPFESELVEQGIFGGEEALRMQWLQAITPTIEQAELTLPKLDEVAPAFGGRKGYHTEHLQLLLDEMTEVIRIDPTVEW